MLLEELIYYMEIKKEELNKFKTYVIYDEGYRIVYYYEKYHEAPEGLYAKKIEDFMTFFCENDVVPEFKSFDDILDKFLNLNSNALGVAIYNINQDCVAKKIKDNVKKINDSMVYKEELIHDYNTIVANEGYRLVYFYQNGNYYISTYAKKIEDFMFEFCESYPIMDEEDIPKFKSADDILQRCLINIKDVNEVAIYDVNGNLVAKKERIKNSIK